MHVSGGPMAEPVGVSPPPATADSSAHAGHVMEPAAGAVTGAGGADPHAGHAGAAPAASLGTGDNVTAVIGGWRMMAMAQAIPMAGWTAPDAESNVMNGFDAYLTQPVAMVNLESPSSRFTLRVTPNFEGLALAQGEKTAGAWGEGFIDSRHPHTLLHEMMGSINFWDIGGGAASISFGRGFAPFGTDDPMSRPVAKYPTNHHLSQILERWTVNGIFAYSGWSVEGGLFGGGEPTGPYDLSNFDSFGDSWSVRAGKRLGLGGLTDSAWELTVSLGRVAEAHGGEKDRRTLLNGAVRHSRMHDFGELYTLVEASRASGGGEAAYRSVLAEGSIRAGRSRPYGRFEAAVRPEFEREAPDGTRAFYRYDHAHNIGRTEWLIGAVGYGHEKPVGGMLLEPFVEVAYNAVSGLDGVDAQQLFRDTRFLTATAGVKILLGGRPMRMGSYGVLDPMTAHINAAASGGVQAH